MAQEVAISGTPSRAKIRNPAGVVGLAFITLGIHQLVWWYSINRELRDLGRARGTDLGQNPGMSCFAYAIPILTLYVGLVWTIVTTTTRIQRSQNLVGEPDVMSGWLAALLWILTLGIGGIVYTQICLNKVWRTMPSAYDSGGGPHGDRDLDRLQKLAELRQSGAISDAEFEAEKARVLPGTNRAGSSTESPQSASASKPILPPSSSD